MPNVVIIGNGGAARECHDLLQDMMQVAPSLKYYYIFKGFLAWKGYQADLKTLAAYDLGHSDEYSMQSEDMFVIGLGEPALRRAAYEEYKAKKASFLTLIHPWSDISSTAQIGEANIFQRGSTIFCDTSVGNANYFNGASNLAHDVTIGDYNFIGPASLILGGCTVGSENIFGVHTSVLPGAKIGNNNMFAPGSIVYKGCKNSCRMAGNPALKIGDV